MTNAQILKERIKKQCEIQGKSSTVMLSELSLGVNAINQINEKKGMGSFALASIADYLGVSVDYLLGRTDNPTGYSGNKNSFNVGNNSTQAIGDNNNISTNQSINEDEREILNILRSLPLKERTTILSQIFDCDEKVKKKET